LVKADFEVPLTKEAKQRIADETIVEAGTSATTASFFPDESLLLLARAYLAFARSLSYSLSKEVRDQITDDLALIRKDDRSFGPEAMHRLLGLARLCALSYGEKELTMERWKQVRKMEDERKARLGAGAATASGAGGVSQATSQATSAVATPSGPLSPSYQS
jgi:Mini-chromosome maintenance replisome factor